MSLSKFKTAALAAACLAATQANAFVFFDVNGSDTGGVISIDVFDWKPDNALFDGAIPIPASPSFVDFTYRAQGVLGSPALTGGVEVTFQIVMPMRALIDGTSSSGSLDILDTVSTGGGTFRVFHDTSADANDITGAGYGLDTSGTDSKEILKGDIAPTVAGNEGSIKIGPTVIGLLDNRNADNQGGVTTVLISGNIPTLQIEIDTFDSTFFPADSLGNTIDIDGEIDMTFDADNKAPFNNVNPSDMIVGAAPDYGDGINNNSCGSKPKCDLHTEADGRSPFKAMLVPEPSIIALLGFGLVAAGASRRFRR